MKHLKSITGLCLAASLLCQIPVYAQIPDGYDEQTWERLNDNRLEYDEIEDLIVNFSPSYLSVKNEMGKIYAPYENAAEDMRATINDWQDELRKAKEDGDMEAVDRYNTMIKGIKSENIPGGLDVTKQMEKAVRTMKGGTDRTLNTTVRGSLVTSTESLMVTYHRLLYAMEIMDASVNLAEASYNSSVTQQSLGMATSDDVTAAQEKLLSAKMQQQSTQNQLNQMKQNLCMLTGWEYNADVEIGSVPEPDANRIAGMNPEIDMEKAIGNNYTLSDMRHTSSGSKVAEKRSRLEQMEEMEEKIKVRLNQSYQSVLQTQAAYQAASSAYESANLTYGASQRQYQLGLISSIQYQQLTVAFLSEKMNYGNAKLDFFQAMEDYDWAVKGMLSLE